MRFHRVALSKEGAEMKNCEMNKLMAHCSHYFQQGEPRVIHNPTLVNPHIDVLLYEPSEAFPFWKMVTMGASDFKMPDAPKPFGNRNEYMMFVDGSVDLEDRDVTEWYYNRLMEVAFYPIEEKCCITYGHSLEWGEYEEEPSDIVGAFIEMPQILEDIESLKCKTGPFKTITCLQVVLLTRAEIDQLMEIGPEAFSAFLYPEEGGEMHYLSERYRSEKF